jgi:hypothetical protein
MAFTVHTTAGQAFPVTHPEAIWQPPDEEDDTVIIHVRDVGVVFTDAPGIADIVVAGRRTADSSAEGQGQ